MKEWTLEQFGAQLASKAPVPGGGGASALAGAYGCALGSMVANLTIGKKKYADVEEQVKGLLQQAERLRAEMLDLIGADAKAFEPLAKAYGLPKETEEEKRYKDQVMEAALLKASLVPLQIMEKAVEMLQILDVLARVGSRLAVSDVGVGVQFCRSAILGASMNVWINTKMMKNRAVAEELDEKADLLITQGIGQADEIFAEVEKTLRR